MEKYTTNADYNQFRNFIKLKSFYERLLTIDEYNGKTYLNPISSDRNRFDDTIIYKDVVITITDNGILRLIGDQIELKHVVNDENVITPEKAFEMGIVFDENDIRRTFFRKLRLLKDGYYMILGEKRKRIAMVETNFKYFPSIENFTSVDNFVRSYNV